MSSLVTGHGSVVRGCRMRGVIPYCLWGRKHPTNIRSTFPLINIQTLSKRLVWFLYKTLDMFPYICYGVNNNVFNTKL